ncbi:polymorphic toxin-type HINT domain-containing protein [Kutzneria sp. NPDC052558]|uniref:polymorphic toxin-type HINT domain-containing protein n=1 Tax=Kutzneria sp. NPDC052558 TaxID=3364121 RepID=UPI0037CC3A21
MLTDHQGTAYASVNADNLGVTQRRQDPFGNARGPASLWPDSHGFVGGPQDTSGLTQLGARGYDSTTGRFTQADPVVDTGDPQQMNGYSYASGSPISSSDPSGMLLNCPNATLHSNCGTNGPGVPGHGNEPYPPPASPTQGQGGGASTAPAPAPPARSSCSWWQVFCQIEQHETAFIAAVTVVAVALTITCAILTFGTCLVPVAAAAAEGAVWGASGMVISAAIAAGAETIGALAVAGAAGVAASEIAETTAGESSSVDGITAETSTTAGRGSPAVKPPAGETVRDVDAESAPASGSSRSVSCNSFAAGTAVLMADGSSKPIQDVHVGDQITNKDPDTGQVQTHAVVATHITDDDHDFVDLTVQTSLGTSTITVTAHHLFWDATTHSWTEADNLKPEDRLDAPDGERVAVAGVRSFAGSMRTYNLTVDEVHTYFALKGEAGVLVHNCGTEPLENNAPMFKQKLEVQSAKDRGVSPATLPDGAGRAALEEGVGGASDFKWAVTMDGELKVMPAHADGNGWPSIELAHTVLAGVGNRVRAAGSGELVDGFPVILTRQTGHFLASEAHMDIAADAFGRAGIDFMVMPWSP